MMSKTETGHVPASLDNTTRQYPLFTETTGRVVGPHGDAVYNMSPIDALFFDAAMRRGADRIPELPATYL